MELSDSGKSTIRHTVCIHYVA